MSHIPTVVTWKVIGPDGEFTRPGDPKGRVAGIEGISGKATVISTVVSAEGRTVTTKSGNVYRLCDMQLAYADWLANSGFGERVNWDCPVPGVSS